MRKALARHKQLVAGSLGLLALVLILLSFLLRNTEVPEPTTPVTTPEVIVEEVPDIPYAASRMIGTSVQGRPITVHTFGNGDTHLLFVGGIHGGYEWNSVLLAYQAIDHLTANPEIVADNLTVSVIPNLNPDGVFSIIGKEGRFTAADAPQDRDVTAPGRFNANNVDLNRNFDCKWEPTSMWRGEVVSAGSSTFSEPEAQALREYALATQPRAAIFWHSKANAVYASECENGILPATRAVMNLYANAAGYKTVDVFDHYTVTGDAEGWLASVGIPAITVELETHTSTEWEQNWAGVEALLNHYGT